MLPTMGFFRPFDCPFFKGGAGQCSRPYCHYKHAKRDPNAPPEPTEDALGTLTEVAVNNEDSSKDLASEGYKSRASLYKATVDAAPTYKPTPIAVLKSSHLPIPYTPSVPSRTPVVKKSKPKEEYVPHSIGGARTYYPPYCPTSTSNVDQLRNPLYEIYGPEGAQFSPNDVDPVQTGYSYAPPKTASYAPCTSSSPDKNEEYVPMPVYNPEQPQFSPSDSQLSDDDDDNVDLAEETAAQTNGVSGKFGEASFLDLDLSEFDDLELEYEDSDPDITDDRGKALKRTSLDSRMESDCEDSDSGVYKVAHIEQPNSKRDVSNKNSSSSKQSSQSSHSSGKSGEKRRSSSSSSSDVKRHKTSHDEDSTKNGHSEEKRSSSKKSSGSSSSKKISSHSSKKSEKSEGSHKSSSSSKPNHTSSSSSKSNHTSSSSSKSNNASSSSLKSSHASSSSSKTNPASSSSSKSNHISSAPSSSSSKSNHISSAPSSSIKSNHESSSSSKSIHESSTTDVKKKSDPLLLESKSKSESSSSTKSKDKDKKKSKDNEKNRERDKHRHRDKEKDAHREKSKHKDKTTHHHYELKDSSVPSSDEMQLDEDEIRQLEAELDASLEDEYTIEQQCYEMFSEFSESMSHNSVGNCSNTEDQRVTVNEEPVAVMTGKKRVAHQAPSRSVEPSVKPVTLAKKCSPYQVMRDRWEMLKKKAEADEAKLKASLAAAPQNVPRQPAPVPYSSTNNPSASLPGSGLPKKKIASVPNVAMLLKKPAPQKSNKTPATSAGTPPVRFYNQEKQRVDEYGRLVKVRVAHAPNMDAPVMMKPIVNPSDCRKFKVPTRQANVNKLYQAYIDAGFGEASHDMALESEKSCCQNTESLGVYSHRVIQCLKDLRACADSSQNGPKLDGLSGIPNRVVSHHAMLAGKLGAKVSWSIGSGKKTTESKLSTQSLYEKLEPYILTKEQLEENGYPMPSSEKGVAKIQPSKYRTIKQPSDPRRRICVRCLKPYTVNKHGIQEKEEECFYHWGRKLTTRRYREAETKYTCCDGTDVQGCSVAQWHVYEPNLEKHAGFMSTLSKPSMEADPGIYALDCEMCYTTAGLELTRVTVIRDDLSTVYETLVKPSHKILDYNTRYSGITEEDLVGVKTTIIQVQATLLGMFCDKSILIGHSLESDMKALKLIHPTVVDTSVVFPHKMGPPQKKALRTLAADYLKKIIQNDVGGHDSKEDAVAAMELMLWKIKEDEKTR